MWPPVGAVALGLLLGPALAGCISTDEARAEADASLLEAYLFTPEGWDLAAGGAPHGLLLRVANTGGRDVTYQVLPDGLVHVDLGRAGQETVSYRQDPGSGRAPEGPQARLAGGEAHAWLLNVHRADDAPGVAVAPVVDGTPRPDQALHVALAHRQALGKPVSPGDHVRTVTVGVWTNGTAFYTNSPVLLQDPDFPAGGHIDRQAALDEAAPLDVYVYDLDRSEQPAASKDTCHFTTVPGYNDLLKHQAEGGAGVRFLAPGEGYTRPGNEDHFLYGDALVFLNVVVSHEGTTGPQDGLPDPQGECFDPGNVVPGGIVPPVTL